MVEKIVAAFEDETSSLDDHKVGRAMPDSVTGTPKWDERCACLCVSHHVNYNTICGMKH